jgi:hypothetical protein
MDKSKLRPRPNVLIANGPTIHIPPGSRRKVKRLHVLEAETRRRKYLLIGTALLMALAIGMLVARFLLP